jgi:copper resistance protein D
MEFLSLYGYLSVLLRGLILGLQSLVVGGVIFRCCIARGCNGGAAARGRGRLMTGSAIGLIVAQAASILLTAVTLRVTTGLGFAELGGATFVVAGLLTIAGAAGVIALRAGNIYSLICCGAILAGSLLASHAFARLDGRAVPAAATLLHQTATAAWIGGLPYLILTLSRSRVVEPMLQRFSRLAMAGVAVLVSAGLVLSWSYIRTTEALVGTTYGVMTLLKVVMLGGLLVLGASNRSLVRYFHKDSIYKLRSFTEAEIGIGFTVILAAASLTSQPPAVDFVANRVSGAQVLNRLAPQWPRLTSPAHSEISPSSREKGLAAVNTAADIAWSEYNHHWAGLIVLGTGLLAMVYRTGYAGWARHWPLLFLGLGAFILLRADPEGWPLGTDSFWVGFANAEVLQHRLAVMLVVAFGIFEWRVRVGLVQSASYSLVFPAVCAAGGVVLLTHAHNLGNIREELLAEISHLLLAVLAVAAGWARWLELRLPEGNRGVVSWVWPVCFALIGVVLLDYREA